ncbi:glycosyltransferase family protein [Mesorhizobium xinjiangense]|uniref:glycosyl transferase family 2 n=1 Tax=Mesorhizobium xinjiangense TaxID=2678685 RepID=UPI0012EE1855|nr:glycosyl transferase family 2 [Mesorhizobium xinjiangense]
MLSVLIETRNDEDALARTLATLVSGAVEGVVRDVVVHDRGSTDQTQMVADHAGCTFVDDGELAAAIRRARGEWLLMLRPGARLEPNWIEAVVFHVNSQDGPARFSRSGRSGLSRLSRLFSRSDPLADGFLMRKSEAVARCPNAGDLAGLVSGLSVRRLPAAITAVGGEWRG